MPPRDNPRAPAPQPTRTAPGLSPRACLLAAALAVCAPALAAEVPPPVRAMLDLYASRGIEILDTFDAPGGWYGVVARARGNGLVLYIDEGGENLFLGMMVDAQGRGNRTEEVLRRYFPDQYPLGAQDPGAGISTALHGIAFTPAELSAIPAVRYAPFDDVQATIYTFVDFGCDHCRTHVERLTSESMRAELAQRRVALAIIPIGFSGAETQYKAAYALAMQPSAQRLLTLFDRDAELPSDLTREQIAGGAEQLAIVMNAVQTHGVSAVPLSAFVFTDTVQLREGALEESEVRGLLATHLSP